MKQTNNEKVRGGHYESGDTKKLADASTKESERNRKNSARRLK